MPASRRILGIDPGLARAGWGVIDAQGPRLSLVAYGAISTGRDLCHADRLHKIYRGLTAVIQEHSPPEMAVEEIFQGKSASSAILLGEGRGACILAGATGGLRVLEYPSSVVKVALTGNGRAAKGQVQAMVCRLLALSEPPRPHDAADALAIAITHFQRGGTGIRGVTGGGFRETTLADPPRTR